MDDESFMDLLLGSRPSTPFEKSNSAPTENSNSTEIPIHTVDMTNEAEPKDAEFDFEDDEPEIPYMHESEDEEIGFVRCLGSDSDNEEDESCDEEIEVNDDGRTSEDVNLGAGSSTQPQPTVNKGGRPRGSGNRSLSNDDEDSGEDIPIEETELLEDEFEDSLDWGREFKVGQVFPTIDELRDRLKEYIIKVGFICRRTKNDGHRLTTKCEGEGCEWRLHASEMADGACMMIKTYQGKHQCVKETNPKEVDTNWLARKIVDELKNNPKVKIKDLIVFSKKELKIDVKYMKVWRARLKAQEIIGGDPTAAFKLLPRYADMVKQCNPGSLAEIVNDPDPTLAEPTFQRFFLGLDALRAGFIAGCSPFLFFDGCHLKGRFGGALLSCVGMDPEGGIFPVAVAVVEIECKESWGFFIHCLPQMFGGFDPETRWHFMADRQKGLVEVIKEQAPHVINRKCARHIYDNFKLKFPSADLRRYFWQASTSYTFYGVNRGMDRIKVANPAAYDWLMAVDVSYWARHAFDPTPNVDHVTNNLSESFNSWIDHIRTYSILGLMEGLRQQIMKRMSVRNKKVLASTAVLMPRTLKKLNDNKDESRRCTIVTEIGRRYEVKDYSITFRVDLTARTCDCRRWDISGIPCRHALVILGETRENPVDFIDEKHTKAAYLRAYSFMIEPIPHQAFWPNNLESANVVCKPPIVKRQRGRPKQGRHKKASEGGKGKSGHGMRKSQVTCGQCCEKGHNSRSHWKHAKENEEAGTEQPTENNNEHDTRVDNEFGEDNNNVQGTSNQGVKRKRGPKKIAPKEPAPKKTKKSAPTKNAAKKST